MAPSSILSRILVPTLVTGLFLIPPLSPAFGQESDKRPAQGAPWKSLFDGKTLNGWQKVNFGGQGDVEVRNGQLVLHEGQSMTGVRYRGGFPKLDYEIRLEAQRLAGNDFFCGLTFRIARLSSEVGAALSSGSPASMTATHPKTRPLKSSTSRITAGTESRCV